MLLVEDDRTIAQPLRAGLSRECFDRLPSVRVSAKMVDQADGTTPVVDWVPKRRRWTLPIGSGLSA